MKKIFFIGIAIVWGVGSFAQPKLTAPDFTVDYGEVEFGGNGERVFKFKNEGKDPLLITNAQGSCGCTVPDWPRDPIMPGQEGTIKIKYDTRRAGPINKQVTITTNEPEGSNTHVVKVKGLVKNQPENVGMPLREPVGVPGQ
ncbi:MAG: DUF1573 domain-containing protein [Flavobacteriales bacterium]|nr:DUF1573 domain-containing protein [Flavobacteriales bacterium]MCX7768809.1 DUF1573 domain-containing protein [Flavobacteriales bacterium]MDW8410417.1 DUF1573 domain-containing protein [Flavobacteriales bacterium]